MRMTTGIIRQGKVELEETDLPDGTIVTVLIPDNEETFEVTPQEKEALLKAIKEVEEGHIEDGWELLQELRRR